MINILAEINIRKDTCTNWQNCNPIMMEAELGYDIDNKKIKVGDGVSAWNDLVFQGGQIDIQEDGSFVDVTNKINFTGALVSVTSGIDGAIDVNISGGTAEINVKDESCVVGSTSVLNFKGSTVTACTGLNGEIDINVSAEPANSNIQAHISCLCNPHCTTYLQVGAEPANSNIQTHISCTNGNPHGTTYSHVGAEPANANIQAHIACTTNNPHNFIPYSGIGSATEPTFTDNGNGTLTVGNTTANLFSTTDFTGNVKAYSVTGTTLSATDGIEQWVAIKYNNGTPVYYIENTKANLNGSSVIPVFQIWRVGTTIHSIGYDSLGLGHPMKICKAIKNSMPYLKDMDDNGLELKETTSPRNRTITISASKVYSGTVPVSVSSYTSDTDLLTFVYYQSSTWNYSNHTGQSYNNTQYQTPTGLATIPTNKFAVRWFYRSIGDVKEAFYVLGTSTYNNITDAEVEQPRTDLPPVIRTHCVLVGKIIIQYNADSGLVYATKDIQFTNKGAVQELTSNFNVVEGNGVLSGMQLSINADPTKINISSGTYYNSSLNIILPYAGVTGQTLTYLNSSVITYIAIDLSGNVVQQITPFTPTQRRTHIILGAAIHSNLTVVNVVNNLPDVAKQGLSQFNDLLDGINAFNVSGNDFSYNGANLYINKSEGKIFKRGVNFHTDSENPHVKDMPVLTAPSNIRYRLSNGTEYADTQSVSLYYESTPGVRTPTTNNKYTIQRIVLFPSNLVRIQYGTTEYSSITEAKASIGSETFTLESNMAQNGMLRGFLIVKGSATALNDPTQAIFIGTDKFGQLPSGSLGGTFYHSSLAQLDYATSGHTGFEPTISKNTAFNVNFETSCANILMDGVACIGTLCTVARADHVHPSDTSKESCFSKNTAFNVNFETSCSNILMDGTACVGTLCTIARADHIHPSDTSKLNASLLGCPNGVACLDSLGKVPSAQLPSYVDDVLEYACFECLPGTGSSGLIYVTTDCNLTYRWSGSCYVEISKSLALGETSTTAYRGDRGKTAYDHSQLSSCNAHGITACMITLDVSAFCNNLTSCDNTIQKAFNTLDLLVATGGSTSASCISVCTSCFGNNLTACENTVQKALDKIDDLCFEPVIVKNTAFNVNFETSCSNILMDGVACVGTLCTIARADHIHPSDTSKETCFSKNTAFNLNFETSCTNILMDGIACVGTLCTIARANHVHPSDTSKENCFSKNTAFNVNFETSCANILMDGIACVGTTCTIARADHVHPSDTSKENCFSKNTAFNLNFETSCSNILMDGVACVGTTCTIARADHIHPSDTSKETCFSKNTAFNLNFETSCANILMDGVACVGTLCTIARANHVHPSDTSKENCFSKNTAFNLNFETSCSNILMDGTACVGTLCTIARANHVHPSDTSKENCFSKGTLAETTTCSLTITGGSGAVIGSGVCIALAQNIRTDSTPTFSDIYLCNLGRNFSTLGTDTKISTGIPWSDRGKFKISVVYNAPNLTASIAFVGANTSFSYYINGKKFTVTAGNLSAYTQTAVAVEGTWFFYINQNTTSADTPVVSLTQSPWGIIDPDALLWNFYFNATDLEITWVGEERHTAGRDIFQHARNHFQGAVYKNGLLASQYNGLTAFSTNTDNNFGRGLIQISGGSFFDEDILNAIVHTDGSIASTTTVPYTNWNLSVEQFLGFTALATTGTTTTSIVFPTSRTLVTGQAITVMTGNTTTVRGTTTITTGGTGTTFAVTSVTGLASGDAIVVGARIPVYYIDTVSGSNYTWRKLEATDFLGVATQASTWARSTTTVTVTFTGHGLQTGDDIRITASSNTTAIPLKKYTVTRTGANTFTITGVDSGTTTGTLTYLASLNSTTVATSTTLSYNNATTGGVTAITAGRYFPMWLLATNLTSEPVIAILGQGQSATTTLATSLGEAPWQFANVVGLTGLNVQEVVPFYRLTYLYNTSAAFNANRIRLSDVTFINVRVSTASGTVLAGGSSTTSASSVNTDTSAFDGWLTTSETTVESALNKLDETGKDGTFRLSDTDDLNRKLAFDLANITTGNTRTITMADRSLNLSTPVFDSVSIGGGTTAKLHLPAGTTSASTAPLKFTSGTAMTNAEDGAVEYHSSHLYFTIGTTRYQLDQQSGGGIVSYTSAQRIALTPTEGQTVYDSTIKALFLYDGSNWVQV